MFQAFTAISVSAGWCRFECALTLRSRCAAGYLPIRQLKKTLKTLKFEAPDI